MPALSSRMSNLATNHHTHHAHDNLVLTKSHYTFDFAQQVTLPHMARQPGPLYFKTPRKVQLFGVCSEGMPLQMNYLLDETETIGPNGTRSHGANSVVSLLHHFFHMYGHGEQQCVLHADNCAGQNKNRTVLSYLAWRTIVGLHKKILLSFMIAGHTRCLVDGCYGLLKQRYRKSDTYTLPQLSEVVNGSAVCNAAHSGGVPWYKWDEFFDQHFSKVPGISKYHHFLFDADKPGVVTASVLVDSEQTAVNILKCDPGTLSQTTLPSAIPLGGISDDRAQYLYKEIRPFVADPYKDDLCPQPVPAEAEMSD
eukprot:scpid39139/ scgid26612/ 